MSVFAYLARPSGRPKSRCRGRIPLMARAARALAISAAAILKSDHGQVSGTRVCVLAGPGNNAGDALFAAATLGRRGAAVTVITLFDRTHDEGLAAARSAGAQVFTFTKAQAESARADALSEPLARTSSSTGSSAPAAGADCPSTSPHSSPTGPSPHRPPHRRRRPLRPRPEPRRCWATPRRPHCDLRRAQDRTHRSPRGRVHRHHRRH